MVRPSRAAALLAFAAALSFTPARATELPDDRLRLTVGMALLEFGGSGWEDLVANGGYGDVRYSPGGWFSDETYTVYPDDSTVRAEMFFADLSYVVGPWWGVGLAVNHNEPFSPWVGFKSTSFNDVSGDYLHVSASRVTTVAPHAFFLIERHASLAVGGGPAFHWTRFEYGVSPLFASPLSSRDDSKLGFMLRAIAEYPFGWFRVGLTAQYDWVGSETLTGADLNDPDFPTSDFSLNYGFVGLHVGLGL